SSDGPVAVSADGDYSTPTGASPEAGTYYWVASYSGDANNAPAASGCEDEPEIGRASCRERGKTPEPAVGWDGASFKGKATIFGLAGSISRAEVGRRLGDVTGVQTCALPMLSSDGPVAVSADGDYSTPTGASPEAGTYYWVASYSGDANNAPAASGCEDEP